MPYRRKKTETEIEIIQKQREVIAFKNHTMIQKARYNLNLMELRIVHYAISKIKPTNETFDLLELDLYELYDLCGLTHESYTAVKLMIQKLADKSWWIIVEDGGKEYDSLVRWFNTLRIDKTTNKVLFKFHDDMQCYLLSLFERYQEYGENYAKLMLKWTLPMKSKYAVRLYELLKSYQVNNKEWWFQIDKLKHLLNADNYKAYKDFRVRVLDPAVSEINKYTDISVEYKTNKIGKKVDKIVFTMAEKSVINRIQAEKDGLTKLEGNIHYWDYKNNIDGQLSLFDMEDE
jgi:plasmid replication initiation protein